MTPHDDFLISMFQEDARLVEAFRQAEAKRRWYNNINWGPLCGALVVISTFALTAWGFLAAYIHVSRWYR